ncbi:carbohydrate kinase family protein [Schumannella luteola]
MPVEKVDTVLVAGHACVDLLPALDAEPTIEAGALSNVGPLEIRCGGSVINTGEALVALGRTIRVSAAVGNDRLGGVLAERLRELDPHAAIDVVDAGTSYSVVLERRGGSRTLWHHEGANARMDGSRLNVGATALVHLGYATALPALVRPSLEPFVALLERMAAAGTTSSIDFATIDPRSADRDEWPERLRRLLPLMGIVSPSADDLQSLGWLPPNPDAHDVAEGARRLVEAGAAIAFVTDGERGAHLCTAGQERLARGGSALARLSPEWSNVELSVPAVPVEHVVGTNGAGDTATAGLIHAVLSGYTPRDAGRLAVALAAQRVAGLDLRIDGA